MLEPEERGITEANADQSLTSADFNVQRFLGGITGYGKILGLARALRMREGRVGGCRPREMTGATLFG